MITSTAKHPYYKAPIFLSTLVTFMLLTGCGDSSNEKGANTSDEATVSEASASANNNASANNSAPASNSTQQTSTENSSSSGTILAQAISPDPQPSQTTSQTELTPQSTQPVQVQILPELEPEPSQTEPDPQSTPTENNSDTSSDNNQLAQAISPEPQPSQTTSQTELTPQNTQPVQAQILPEPEPSQTEPFPQSTPTEHNSDTSSDNNQGEVTQDGSLDSPQNNQNTQRTMHILPLGDSITNGGEGFPSYRRSLWFMLRNGDYDVDFVGSQRGFDGPVSDGLKDFDLDHEGHWAWEMGELENSLPDWINDYTPDIVLLHAGTNDVDRGQSHDSTISELDGIVNILRNKNANVVVLLAKIIPMQNRDTADFNEFIESFATSKTTSTSPVVIVDQHEGYDPSNDNYDNYHPNSIGEEKMATRWLNALEPYLN